GYKVKTLQRVPAGEGNIQRRRPKPARVRGKGILKDLGTANKRAAARSRIALVHFSATSGLPRLGIPGGVEEEGDVVEGRIVHGAGNAELGGGEAGGLPAPRGTGEEAHELPAGIEAEDLVIAGDERCQLLVEVG